MPNSFIRDVREVLRRLRNRGIELDGNRQYPAIPTIDDTIESHTNALRAIREALETHERRNPRAALDSFVRLYELEDVLGGFQQGESSVTNIYNTGTTVEFATPEETDAGTLETKAIHPFGGAYAYDRLRWPSQHTAGKGTATVTLVPNSGVVVIDGDLSNVFEITLDADVHFDDPINLKSGQTYNVLIAQDAVGGHVATYGASWTFVNQIDPVLTETADAVDLLSCQWHASAGKTRAVLLPNYGAGYVVPPVYDIADFQFINLGGGNEVVIGKDQYDPELYFRTIVGGGDISVSTVGDTIAISYSTPEAVDYSGVPFALWQDTAEFPGLPEARQLTGGANILVDTSDMYDVVISCIAPGIPPEGAVGQFLRKSGENDYEVEWSDPIEGVNILADLEDVDLTGLTDGDTIVYDATYGMWMPGAGSAVAALGDLTDVTITTPATDQVLKYNGSEWVNAAAPAGATTLDGLTDVTITTPAAGQTLSYDGSEWKNVDVEQIKGIAPRYVRVYLSGAATTTSTGWQKVPLDTVTSDENNLWDSTNKYITPDLPGYYLVVIRARTTVTGATALSIRKNGSNATAIGPDSSLVALSGSGLIYCNGSTDYLEAGIYSSYVRTYNTGNFDTYMEVIGPVLRTAEESISYNDGCEVARTTTQAITGTTYTGVVFDTEIRDDNSYWTNTNPSRFTAPASGWYAVSFSVHFDTTSSQCSLFISKNGSSSTLSNRIAATLPASAVGSSRHSVSCITYLAAGDYLLFETYASISTNIIGASVPARASIHRLGAAVGTAAEGCTVRRAANAQTITTATNTAVTFDTEVRDDEGYANLAAFSSRLTIPVAGWYTLFGDVQWDSNTTGRRVLWFRVNGDTATNYGTNSSSVISDMNHSTTATLYLNAGDYVEMYVYQDSGGTRTLSLAYGMPRFSILRIPGFPRGTGGTADNVSFDDTNAALGGTNVQDTLDILAEQLRTSGGHVRASGARLTRSTTQSIAHNTTTAIQFDTEVYDNEEYADLSTNNTRLTAPVTGWYYVNGRIDFASSAGGRLAYIRVNGDTSQASRYGNFNALSGGAVSPSAIIYLTRGDYVELIGVQTSGGSDASANHQFNMVRLEGKSDVQDSGMEFVGEAIVTDAAATTLTVSGLDLDADEEYHITASLKNATASAPTISLYYNADTTATNYDRAGLNINNTTLTGARANDGVIGGLNANASGTFSTSNLTRDQDGKPRSMWLVNREATTALLAQTWFHMWRTSANVTSITLSSSVASALAIGSYIRVWRRRRITTTPREKAQVANLVITSNAVYQDTDLVFTLTPGTYAIKGMFYNYSHTTPDMVIQDTFTGTAESYLGTWRFRAVNSGSWFCTDNTTLPTQVLYGTTGSYITDVEATIVVTVTGEYKIQAKQNTSSATSVTFYKNSRLQIRRIS